MECLVSCDGVLHGCGSFRISCQVTVLVCDANDNCPHFTTAAVTKTASVSEVSWSYSCTHTVNDTEFHARNWFVHTFIRCSTN